MANPTACKRKQFPARFGGRPWFRGSARSGTGSVLETAGDGGPR